MRQRDLKSSGGSLLRLCGWRARGGMRGAGLQPPCIAAVHQGATVRCAVRKIASHKLRASHLRAVQRIQAPASVQQSMPISMQGTTDAHTCATVDALVESTRDSMPVRPTI